MDFPHRQGSCPTGRGPVYITNPASRFLSWFLKLSSIAPKLCPSSWVTPECTVPGSGIGGLVKPLPETRKILETGISLSREATASPLTMFKGVLGFNSCCFGWERSVCPEVWAKYPPSRGRQRLFSQFGSRRILRLESFGLKA